MEITVLGAGHGGVAMSSDLRLLGHNVKLYAVENHSLNIKLIEAVGRIHIDGVTTCMETPVEVIADFIEHDIEKAIKGSEIIFVNVPAFAQEVYNENIIK
ncbi:MAG: NAD/NADP octopine/nopaline dehydrogenase, partial [Candidatus Gastranaerophilaceae bacterium]